MKICKASLIGPKIGQTQLIADRRICLPHINVGAVKGTSGVYIVYGSSGRIIYGSSGKIIY